MIVSIVMSEVWSNRCQQYLDNCQVYISIACFLLFSVAEGFPVKILSAFTQRLLCLVKVHCPKSKVHGPFASYLDLFIVQQYLLLNLSKHVIIDIVQAKHNSGWIQLHRLISMAIDL